MGNDDYIPIPSPYQKDVDGYIGLRDANTFDFTGTTSNAWQMKTSMGYRRWYPTATTLPTGDVLVVAGQQYGGSPATPGGNPVQADIPEVYEAATDSWRKVANASNVYAARKLPFYPWMFVAPDGRVFNAGPNVRTGFLDVAAGTWADGPLDTSSGITVPAAGNYDYGSRYYGTAVMYEPGKIIIMSGGPFQAALLDLNATNPQWTPAAAMAYPARVHVNSTLLADGSVLVTGGTPHDGVEQEAVLPAERWTPPTPTAPGGTWTTMNAMAVPRLYHSTAVLLPDGRVLSTGGGQGGGYQDRPTYEIFSPPYLFTGTARPVVAQVPAQVSYGQAFSVQTTQATHIRQVNLIGLSSVTHSFNMNQRLNHLPFTVIPGGLTLTPPSRAIDCPPGYYMLFLVDDYGVPSQANIVRIVDGPPTGCNTTLSLSIVQDDQYWANCDAIISITATPSTAAGSYHWSIDKVYNPSFDGQATISLHVFANNPTRKVEVAAQPACGGAAVATSQTFTTYFPQCPTSSD